MCHRLKKLETIQMIINKKLDKSTVVCIKHQHNNLWLFHFKCIVDPDISHSTGSWSFLIGIVAPSFPSRLLPKLSSLADNLRHPWCTLVLRYFRELLSLGPDSSFCTYACCLHPVVTCQVLPTQELRRSSSESQIAQQTIGLLPFPGVCELCYLCLCSEMRHTAPVRHSLLESIYWKLPSVTTQRARRSVQLTRRRQGFIPTKTKPGATNLICRSRAWA